MKAYFLGLIKGQRVFRFPVEITFGEEAAVLQVNHYPTGTVDVIAHTAAEAADLIADELHTIPCVELTVYGVKGGTAAHRYWGFDRAVFWTMFCVERNASQLALRF